MAHFTHDYEQGIRDEQDRMMKLLLDKGIIRESIFGDDDWLVAYTAEGGIDISKAKLLNKEAK